MYEKVLSFITTMANYLSTPLTYQNPLPTYNFELVSKALEFKQGAINQNVEKLQNQIDQYAQIDLAKDVDKEHLANNLTNMVNQINSLEGADYSSQNITGLIQGNIKRAIDDKVITAAASTQNFRKLQSNIDYFRTKEIDKYNPLNEAFALRGAQQWLSNPNAGVGYQGGVYTPYVDKNKAMLAIVKDLKETKGDQVIEVPVTDAQGNRRIQRRSIKGLTSEEIQAYLPNLVPTEVKQQLQIDGWGQYQGQGGLTTAQTVFDTYVTDRNNALDRGIQTATIGEGTSGLSKKQRAMYSRQKQALLNQKESFNSEITQINVNDTASLGGFIETNRWMNNFSQIAGARESVEYETDTAFYAQKNLELDYSREARQQRESELGMVKTQLEIAKMQSELNPDPTLGIAVNPAVGAIAQEIDPVADATNEYNTLAQGLNQTVTAVYRQANDDQRQLFDAEKAKYKQQGQTESNANYLAFNKIFKQSNPQEAGTIENLRTEKDNIAVNIQKSKDEAITGAFASNASQYYRGLDSLRNEPDVRTFLTNNKISPESLASPGTSIAIKRRAADLLQKYSTVTRNIDLFNFAGESEEERGLINFDINTGRRRNFDFRNGITTVRSPYEDTQATIQQNLKNRGYAGFNRTYSANLTNEKEREAFVSMIPQDTGGFVFTPKNPITINKNSDGSLRVTQATEGRKEGGIFAGAPRYVDISTDSDAYRYIAGKLDLAAARRSPLSADTPTIKSNGIEYIDETSSDILTNSAQYIQQRTGGTPLTSGVNPVNYLNTSTTKQIFNTALQGRVAPQKINQLVDLMEANGDKIEVRADVEKGRWKVAVNLNGVGKTQLYRNDGGTEENNEQVNLYVKQFPQITASDAMLRYLSQNPNQIDNVLSTLQE